MSIKGRLARILIWNYAAALVLFTVYAALDIFVIPRRLGPVSGEVETTTTQFEQSVTGSPDTALSVENVTSGSTSNIIKSAHGESVKQTELLQQVQTDGASRMQTTDPERTAESLTALDIPGEVIGTYEDENTYIRITQTEAYDTDIYVADIVLSSPDALKTALAYDTYGRNVKQETSEMAQENDAVLAINGDFYGSRTEGYVLRNGVLYRDRAGSDREGLAILSDGSFLMFDESDTGADELAAMGAAQVFSFGPALLEDGTITVTQNQEVGKAMASNPRTAIGIVDDLHYVFVVSDGRTTESKGLSLYELAQVLQSAGVRDAYNLDGGGSSTMVFQGEVVNNPATSKRQSGEREVSDIVYIGR